MTHLIMSFYFIDSLLSYFILKNEEMECFKYSNGIVQTPDEIKIREQGAVTVYDNLQEKTVFQRANLLLTNRRIICSLNLPPLIIVELKLNQIVNFELKQVQSIPAQSNTVASSIVNRSRQTLVTRLIITAYTDSSLTKKECIQFEFEYGGHNEFFEMLKEQVDLRQLISLDKNQVKSSSGNMGHSVGITGIQRNIQNKLDLQDQKINDSFKDLNILMNQAKEMVNLSNVLIGKLTSKTASGLSGEMSEDNEDMNKLKGYFANMGIIDNPVTKESSGSKYYKDLAMEISHNFTQIIIDNGGIMTLSDVYCRLNRARGIAGLISSEDLLNACKQINKLNLKLKYNVYADLNLHVLEIETTKANFQKLDQVCELIEKNESLTPYALSKLLNINLIVAKKFLLDAEKLGRLCRDDTNVGLKFYSNLFLIK